MIVELKKVKITKSILSQLTSPLFNEIAKYEVLGWVFDKSKYILLYNKETKTLSKMRVLFSLRIDSQKPNQVLYMRNGLASFKAFQSNQEALNWCALINTIQSQAIIQGQLFI